MIFPWYSHDIPMIFPWKIPIIPPRPRHANALHSPRCRSGLDGDWHLSTAPGTIKHSAHGGTHNEDAIQKWTRFAKSRNYEFTGIRMIKPSNMRVLCLKHQFDIGKLVISDRFFHLFVLAKLAKHQIIPTGIVFARTKKKQKQKNGYKLSKSSMALYISGWWYTYPSKKIWKPVGVTIPNIWKIIIHSCSKHLNLQIISINIPYISYTIYSIQIPCSKAPVPVLVFTLW